MKTLLTSLLIIIYLNVNAQQEKGSLMVGNKAFELSYIYENEEGLGFGLAGSIVHSGLTEKRANKNDHFNEHEFTSKVTPAVFALISGNFEEVTIIGKIGTAYVDQKINGIPDSKKLYFAVGIAFEVPVTEEISIRAEYDNVNSVLIGMGFKI